LPEYAAYDSINVVGYELDGALSATVKRIEHVEQVSAFNDLPLVLQRWNAVRRDTHRVCTLDLLGHSTGASRHLELGQSIINMDDPTIIVQATTLARSGLLNRLFIGAVRLLGCSTAVELGGQRTMRRLSHVLGIPVFGTSATLLPSHYSAQGFDPIFRHILVDVRDMPPVG